MDAPLDEFHDRDAQIARQLPVLSVQQDSLAAVLRTRWLRLAVAYGPASLLTPDGPAPRAVRQRLQELGYVEGQNLVLEVRAKVGFWKNPAMRELLTRALVRDLVAAGICQPGSARDLVQRLVALAKENHENLTRS